MLFKKQNIIFFLVLLTTVLSSPLEVKAQWKLDVKGTVKNEDTKKRFEGVTITIKRNGAVWKTVTTPPTGEFTLELPPDAVYLVEFSKPGFTAKRIEFSTKNVPPEDAMHLPALPSAHHDDHGQRPFPDGNPGIRKKERYGWRSRKKCIRAVRMPTPAPSPAPPRRRGSSAWQARRDTGSPSSGTACSGSSP